MEKCSSPSSSSSVNGLKFGKKIYFEDMGSGVQPKAAPPSPAKKGRTGMVEPARCQVEGCNVDLSDAKAYYSRHKVCGMHSKFPKVIVGGIEQRFCQQCSRFHQLPEFDQDKRSCRRRLAGHNERRRKPPPGSYLPSLRTDNHSKTGGLFMDFRAYSTTPSWTNAASGQVLENQKPQLTWLSHSQNPASDLVQASSTQLSYSSPGIHSDECFNGVSDASSALSLLSNQPWSSKPRSSGYEPISNLALIGPSMNPGIAIGGQFSCPSWDSPDMPPDLGLGQTSHPASNQYAGELGLAQPGDGQFHQVNQSRGFDTSTQHRHWSL